MKIVNHHDSKGNLDRIGRHCNVVWWVNWGRDRRGGWERVQVRRNFGGEGGGGWEVVT